MHDKLLTCKSRRRYYVRRNNCLATVRCRSIATDVVPPPNGLIILSSEQKLVQPWIWFTTRERKRERESEREEKKTDTIRRNVRRRAAPLSRTTMGLLFFQWRIHQSWLPCYVPSSSQRRKNFIVLINPAFFALPLRVSSLWPRPVAHDWLPYYRAALIVSRKIITIRKHTAFHQAVVAANDCLRQRYQVESCPFAEHTFLRFVLSTLTRSKLGISTRNSVSRKLLHLPADF